MTWVAKTTPMGVGDNSYGFQVVSNGSVAVICGTPNQFGGIGQNTIQWSSDGGATWHLASVNPLDDGSSVIGGALCWSEDLGLWLVTGWAGGGGWHICTSPDGDVWTSRFSDPPDAPGIDLGYGSSVWLPGPAKFVVMTWGDAAGRRCLTSPDGITWTINNTNGMTSPNWMAWSDTLGLAVVVGRKGFDGTFGPVATSTDGINWTNRTTPYGTGDSTNPSRVIWSDTWQAFYVNGAGKLIRSYDGISWEDITPDGGSGGPVGELKDGSLLQISFPPAGSLSRDGGDTWLSQPVNPATYDMFDITSDAGANYIVGSTTGDASTSVVMTGNPIRVIPPAGPGGVGGVGGTPLWKYFLASLDGTGIVEYSKLASARSCEVVLNAPLSLHGRVPSDDPQVYLPYTDDGYDDPYLNEGTRLLWGFRRESDTSPYYTVRAATIIQLLQDTAEQDNATTAFQGWDPWHYMFSRPVCLADGTLPGKDGFTAEELTGDATPQVADVIGTLLSNTITNHGFAYIDAGTTYGGSFGYTGTLQTGVAMELPPTYKFTQGQTVGQVWQELTAQGLCDIVLTPIYTAPDGRTLTDFSTVYNLLVELNVYAQAGATHDELIFAWNLPGRSLVGIDRQFAGSDRADKILFFAGQGGTSGSSAVETDAAAVAKYGEYWSQQFFPELQGAAGVVAVTSLAQQQLLLRASGKETVTFRPAPERSPRPWQDYSLGDRVPVWASRERFRDVLGEEQDGTLSETQYQRIYGWTANISDNALETIDPVLTSPEGFTP